MKKFKKKFLLTGLALAVPLVGVIASACSEVSQYGPTTPPATSEMNNSSSNIGSLENLPMFIKHTK